MPRSPSPAAPQTGLLPLHERRLVMLGVNMGVLMATIDISIVNLALPSLVGSLHASFALIQWVPLSYTLVLTSLMLAAARLGDLHGIKKPYLTGVAIFTAASLLCGLAVDAYWLVAARALQGLGAALMQALGVAMVTMIHPPDQRGRALGLVGGIVSLGLALGPALGGILIEHFGWRSVFLVNLPLGGLAFIQVARHLKLPPPAGAGQRFDLAGAGLLMASLVCYAMGMTLGQQWGFTQTAALVLLLLGGLGLAAFLWLESRLDQPVVDLGLFKDRLFSVNLLMGFLSFVQLGGALVAPFYLELVMGLTTQQAGLMMMVVPVSMGLVAPWSGRLSDRLGSRGISMVGLAVILCGCLAMLSLTVATTPLGYILRALPIGLGMGLFQSPNNSALMGRVPPHRLGVASGLLSLSRTLGNTSGIPLMATIFSLHALAATHSQTPVPISDAPPQSLLAGIHGVYILASALALCAVGLAALAWRWDSGAARAKASRP